MAASRSKLDEAEAKKFRENVTRLQNFSFHEDEKSKSTVGLLLDEIVAIEPCFCIFQHETEGSELLGYLATLIPLYLDRLLVKFCHVIFNFCAQKNVALNTDDLHALVHFLTRALQQCPSFVYPDILIALTTVCENNTHRIQKFHDVIVGGRGLLLQLTDDTTCEDEVVIEAVKCLAVFTCIRPNHADRIEVCYLSASFDTFVHLLHRAPHMKMGLSLRNKVLVHSLSGIQNIVMLKRIPNIELGILFAAVRAYMFYGLTSQTINVPAQLYPNVVMPYDPLASSKTSKAAGEVSRRDTNKSAASASAENAGESGSGRDQWRGGAAATGDKPRNKKPRRKRGRARGGGDGEMENERREDEMEETITSGAAAGETCGLTWHKKTADTDTLSWEMNWLKVNSSDSEYSDTEGGRARQQKSEAVRVRQCALNSFLNVVRVIDKKVMFGYWSSFIPDMSLSASTPQMQQSLFTAILKDPSPKCRMAAVASLTSMLESTRPYLAAAEEISTHSPAFTPFSAILGSMIREMHRCLLHALVAENFKAVLTQIIKCLANLVNNVPYHRLNPGLLTRVLKQVRHFFNHKDPNVRTACLTCIGAMVGIKPPLMEVSQLIKPPHPPVGVNRSANPGDSPLFRPEDASYLLYPSFSTPQVSSVLEETCEPECVHSSRTTKVGLELCESLTERDKVCIEGAASCTFNGSENFQNAEAQVFVPEKDSKRDKFECGEPVDISGQSEERIMSDTMIENGNASTVGVAAPMLESGSGMDTPVYTDQLLQAHARETSWVIKFCVRNITGQPDIQNEDVQSRLDTFLKYEPLPIRLEALQVMSNLIKNYFPVIRQSLRLLQNLVQMCLEDPNHIIKLHGAKVLDELTQALQQDVVNASVAPNSVISFQQVLDFWLFLLEGPLPQLLSFNPEMSLEGNNLVRSGACECMANIGEEVFAKLPMPRQMQCVTLVLGLAGDEDKLIRAAAVRALGIYIMYATLKDDVAYVQDAGKAILACMGSSSNSVRCKAAWAMANLCDTLVSNKDNKAEEFISDFPDSMLLHLVQCAAACTKDSDKISCNAARAIGNLLRYLPASCFQQTNMERAVEMAVKGLVKNMNSGTMKVRWNSCYAASNAFQNPCLPYDKPWVSDILNMLCKVVQVCTNFKVRINAALGLSAPPNRQGYGSRETFSNAWTSLVSALETAENINDFAEYKYKDSLTEHLCGAVLRITSLVELEDLSFLSQSVHIKSHSFRSYMEKYTKLQLSKKGQSNIPNIEEVKGHLERLLTGAISDEQRRCLQGLVQACVPDIDSSDERTPEKTSFQQIYD